MSWFGALISGVGYDASYQAWLDRLISLGYAQPTAACSQILSDMIAGIKTDGNWTELDRFWFMAHNGDSDGATVDMVNPTGHSQATKVNSPGWTAKQGINTNGTTSYWNLNYNPGTGTHKLTQNSAGVGFWMHTASNEAATNRNIFGSANGTTSQLLIQDNATVGVNSRINQAGTGDSAFTGNANFASGKSYGTLRTGATTGNNYVDGVSVSPLINTSVAVPNFNIFVLCVNASGTPSTFSKSDWKISVIWFGSGLVNQTEMHSRISTAMAAIALLP